MKKGNIVAMVIINTGGTFNKFYNEVDGRLEVSNDEQFILEILQKSKITQFQIVGLLYKDSLDITNEDRKKLVDRIDAMDEEKFLIVHGTDTMSETAEFLDQYVKEKQIVLVGAMQPYSIEPVEATSNFMLGYGYLLTNNQPTISIAMHGFVKNYQCIKKNKEKGIFECLN